MCVWVWVWVGVVPCSEKVALCNWIDIYIQSNSIQFRYPSFDISTTFFSGSRGFLYSLFCSGGINHDDPWNPKDNKENGMMKFFRDTIGEWLCKPWAKALVLTVFVTYIGFACWGVMGLEEGLEKKRLSRFDSYSVEYYNTEEKYFMEYPFRINVSSTFSLALLHRTNDHPMHPKVVVSGVVDYSDKKVQKEMEELLRALENTTFIDPLYTESWLRSDPLPPQQT